MSDNQQTVLVRHSGSPGTMAGMLGCGLGILGIFTFGIIFVPLAALCSTVGVVRGIAGHNGGGIGISILGIVLSIAGFFVSPSLWILFALGSAGH